MGIFASESNLFTRVAVTLEMKGKLVGGIPKDPKLIQGWLRKNMGVTDQQELLVKVRETMIATGVALKPDATLEEMFEASERIAGERQTTGFKMIERVHPDGTPMFKEDADGNLVLKDGKPQRAVALILEGRQLKAMLKEVTNILFAGEKWGTTRKGPKSFLAERVFIEEEAVILHKPDGQPFTEPSGLEMMIGHVTGPQGPRSTLGYHEHVEGALLSFTLLIAQDAIPHDAWPDLWVLAEQNGLGATRSQSYGKFDIRRFEVIKQGDSYQAARIRPRDKADEAEEAGAVVVVPADDKPKKATRAKRAAVLVNGHQNDVPLDPNQFSTLTLSSS